MKVKLAMWIRDLGDGSVSPLFFASEKRAEDAVEAYMENHPYTTRLCYDIESVTLEIDSEGNLLNPAMYDAEEDEWI